MTDILVRKEDDKPAQITTAWDPMRLMRDLMGWDPFREMMPLGPQGTAGFMPSFEVKETAEGYSFKADLPGVKESDVEVTLNNNRLTISGKREAEKKEKTDTYYTYERSYGSFSRSFTLPAGADQNAVHADLKDGVLNVVVKKTAEAKPKKIPVGTPAKKS